MTATPNLDMMEHSKVIPSEFEVAGAKMKDQTLGQQFSPSWVTEAEHLDQFRTTNNTGY